jgi:hypothetical protein
MERPLVGRPPKECSIGPAPLTVVAQHAGAGAVQDESLRATSLLSFDGRAHASAASPSAAGRSIEASPLPEVIAAPPDTHESDLSAMVKGEQITNARAAAAQAVKEAAAAERAAAERLLDGRRAGAGRAVAPVDGGITSNYGPRWGSTHYGLDVANSIGTPDRVGHGRCGHRFGAGERLRGGGKTNPLDWASFDRVPFDSRR